MLNAKGYMSKPENGTFAVVRARRHGPTYRTAQLVQPLENERAKRGPDPNLGARRGQRDGQSTQIDHSFNCPENIGQCAGELVTDLQGTTRVWGGIFLLTQAEGPSNPAA